LSGAFALFVNCLTGVLTLTRDAAFVHVGHSLLSFRCQLVVPCGPLRR
jgi:hypothetical protein